MASLLVATVLLLVAAPIPDPANEAASAGHGGLWSVEGEEPVLSEMHDRLVRHLGPPANRLVPLRWSWRGTQRLSGEGLRAVLVADLILDSAFLETHRDELALVLCLRDRGGTPVASAVAGPIDLLGARQADWLKPTVSKLIQRGFPVGPAELARSLVILAPRPIALDPELRRWTLLLALLLGQAASSVESIVVVPAWDSDRFEALEPREPTADSIALPRVQVLALPDGAHGVVWLSRWITDAGVHRWHHDRADDAEAAAEQIEALEKTTLNGHLLASTIASGRREWPDAGPVRARIIPANGGPRGDEKHPAMSLEFEIPERGLFVAVGLGPDRSAELVTLDAHATGDGIFEEGEEASLHLGSWSAQELLLMELQVAANTPRDSVALLELLRSDVNAVVGVRTIEIARPEREISARSKS